MTKLEEVARVIAKALADSGMPTVIVENRFLVSQSYESPEIIPTGPIVEAILKALRNPTEEMVSAGSRSRPYREDDGYYDGEEYRANTEGTWESMIDSILSEGERQE